MKSLTTLVFMIVSCLCLVGAEKSFDTARYFAFPRAVIAIETADIKTIADCSGCFSQPTANQPEPKFSGGHKFTNGTLSGTVVTWELVRKTSHGDVYLIVVTQPDKSESVTPIVFTGKALSIITTSNLTVRILPDHPEKE